MLFRTNRKKIAQLEQRIKLIETQLELDEVENTQEFVKELYKKIDRKKKEQALLIKNKTNPTRRKR